MEVTASYSRKINHKLYGGNDYESSDFFCSVHLDVDDETDVQELYGELHDQCRMAVDKAKDMEIAGMQGGIPQAEFMQFIWDYAAGRKLDGEVYQSMSRYQQDIIQTMKRGKAAAKRDQAKLTDNNNENAKEGE